MLSCFPESVGLQCSTHGYRVVKSMLRSTLALKPILLGAVAIIRGAGRKAECYQVLLESAVLR